MSKNMEYRYKQIGQNICNIRKKHKLTQEELAERIRLSKSYLSKIEAKNCYKRFSLDVLFKISDELDIDIKELFKFQE